MASGRKLNAYKTAFFYGVYGSSDDKVSDF